jgi:hypothetical protein
MDKARHIGDLVFDVRVQPANDRWYVHTYLGLSGAEAHKVRAAVGAERVSITPRKVAR